MRKTVSILAVALFCIGLHAQDNAIINELTSILDSNQVLAHYSYCDASGAEIGNGTATIQGRKYVVSEGKAMFISNGATLYSVFSDRKEIYIENAGSSSDIFSNLPSLLQKVKDLKWDGTNLSFSMELQGAGKLLCKARVQKLPWNDNGQFTVSEDLLNSNIYVVTDLR